METLADVLAEAKSKYPGCWLTLGGDWNGRSLLEITDALPELQKTPTGPTRELATLDILLTNHRDHLVSSRTIYPLESDSLAESDHKIVLSEALLPRERAFSWEIHTYLQITKEGDKEFKRRLKNESWDRLREVAPDGHAMALKFHEVLKLHLEACYSWKRIRRKSNDCLLYTSPSPRDS